ncbi:hypothetical protein [Microbacterium sp. BH-3-3-3]|uniref:hypothetical protein n=1 Tax=Microbacterium sp. BH-3-3-3 TaxID=1906742 RepID=UPI000892992A|nr:hypothetical protein [Microbacterium sp. BH-3-3-3]AOX46665.1 hypothetical protein BJP65_13350 [Microbacterium sp. BH-3-3-3]
MVFTLTAAPGAWGPGTVALTYQWKANGTVIAGATANTYRVASRDVGKTLTVTVTGKKSGYATRSRGSSATKTVVT